MEDIYHQWAHFLDRCSVAQAAWVWAFIQSSKVAPCGHGGISYLQALSCLLVARGVGWYCCPQLTLPFIAIHSMVFRRPSNTKRHHCHQTNHLLASSSTDLSPRSFFHLTCCLCHTDLFGMELNTCMCGITVNAHKCFWPLTIIILLNAFRPITIPFFGGVWGRVWVVVTLFSTVLRRNYRSVGNEITLL
jgi:hypothetical protein